MKSWLQGMVAVGVLTGGVLVAGCTDQRPESDVFSTPIQDKYQPPEGEPAEMLGDERKVHPTREGERGQVFQSEDELGERTIRSEAPGLKPLIEREPGEGLGTGLSESYGDRPAEPATGTGGAGEALEPAEPTEPADADEELFNGELPAGAGHEQGSLPSEF